LATTLLSISENPPENPIGTVKPPRSSFLDAMRQGGPALAIRRISLRSLSSGSVLRGPYRSQGTSKIYGSYRFTRRHTLRFLRSVTARLDLVPGEGAISVRFGIAVPTDASTLASIYSVQRRSDPVLGVYADGVAGELFPKRCLAGRNILRECC
jgi:hypothetical protein